MKSFGDAPTAVCTVQALSRGGRTTALAAVAGLGRASERLAREMKPAPIELEDGLCEQTGATTAKQRRQFVAGVVLLIVGVCFLCDSFDDVFDDDDDDDDHARDRWLKKKCAESTGIVVPCGVNINTLLHAAGVTDVATGGQPQLSFDGCCGDGVCNSGESVTNCVADCAGSRVDPARGGGDDDDDDDDDWDDIQVGGHDLDDVVGAVVGIVATVVGLVRCRPCPRSLLSQPRHVLTPRCS